MGTFDGMTEDDVREVERFVEITRRDFVRRGRSYVVGKLEGCVVIALGYDEAKHAVRVFGMAGGLALPDWKTLSSIIMPAAVHYAAVVCVPSDLDEARAVVRRLNRTGIKARVRLRTRDIPRETERDSLLRKPGPRLVPYPSDPESS